MIIPRITQYFQLAKDNNASDIFITSGSKPALKINGDVVLIEGSPLITQAMAEKYLLDVLTEEQKKYFEENLDIDFGITVKDFGRYRVNAFLNKEGIGMVFRPIADRVPGIEDLNLPNMLKKLASLKHGLVLVTGATGSGKSSTLAAILQEINKTKKKHIVTIEDPIEFIHDNGKSIVNQREVYTNTQSFAMALRSALRQAADVILVGEMRDPETVALALEAAETGVLVFATLHTSGTAKAIDRIIDIFPFEKQNHIRSTLSLSLKAVVWQELVKRKDKRGRVPVCEILMNNSEISNMIRKGLTHQIPMAIQTGSKDGMITMEESLKRMKGSGLV